MERSWSFATQNWMPMKKHSWEDDFATYLHIIYSSFFQKQYFVLEYEEMRDRERTFSSNLWIYLLMALCISLGFSDFGVWKRNIIIQCLLFFLTLKCYNRTVYDLFITTLQSLDRYSYNQQLLCVFWVVHPKPKTHRWESP